MFNIFNSFACKYLLLRGYVPVIRVFFFFYQNENEMVPLDGAGGGSLDDLNEACLSSIDGFVF